MKEGHRTFLFWIGVICFLLFVPVVQYDYEKIVCLWDAWGHIAVFPNGTEYVIEERFPNLAGGEKFQWFADRYNCTLIGPYIVDGGTVYETWHYSGSILHYLFKIGYGTEWKSRN